MQAFGGAAETAHSKQERAWCYWEHFLQHHIHRLAALETGHWKHM